jgi:hypothetical protein
MTSAVLRADIDEVLEAAIERLNDEHLDDTSAEVLAFKQLLEDEGAPLEAIIATARQNAPLPSGTGPRSEAELLAHSLDPYVRIAALTAGLFTADRTPGDWQSKPVTTAVVALARVRSALGQHPDEIRRLLAAAIAACAQASAQHPGRAAVESGDL